MAEVPNSKMSILNKYIAGHRTEEPDTPTASKFLCFRDLGWFHNWLFRPTCFLSPWASNYCSCYVLNSPIKSELDHTVVLFQMFWGSSIVPSPVASPVSIPLRVCLGSLFSTSSPALLTVVFLVIAILSGVRWYLSMVLIYIYQMISNADHLFICYWPSVSLLWKTCLFRFSAHFLIGLFVFLYWLVWGVYIFWI